MLIDHVYFVTLDWWRQGDWARGEGGGWGEAGGVGCQGGCGPPCGRLPPEDPRHGLQGDIGLLN